MSSNKHFVLSLSNGTILFRIFGLQYFKINIEKFQDNQVSRNFKFYFVSVLTILTAQTGLLTWVLISSAISSDKNVRQATILGEITHIGMFVFLLFSVIHAYIETAMVKKILSYSLEIAKIIENSLTLESDYEGFNKKFNKLLTIFGTILGISEMLLLIFTYIYNWDEMFAVIIFETVPYTFVQVIILRFIFFVMLTNHNIGRIRKFFELKIKQGTLIKFYNKKQVNFTPFVNNDLEKILSVKRIYAIIWKMTRLINKVSGPSISVFLFLVVGGNSLAGYMIFLGTKGVVPFKDLGGLKINFIKHKNKTSLSY